MSNDRAARAWQQIRGKVKEHWGRLTNNDLKQLEGHFEQLAGKLQKRYGLAREEAEQFARQMAERHLHEYRGRHEWRKK